MTKHVMVDLETWSTKSNALIVSIGAVHFDPLGGDTKDRFHTGVDPRATGVTSGTFDINPDMLIWWMDARRDPARTAWNGLQKIDLPSALLAFAMWCEQLAGDGPIAMWGNGATFDNVILANAYDVLNIAKPWGFHGDRCYRTMKGLDIGGALLQTMPAIGVSHNALDDAQWQAVHMQRIVDHLGLLVD